MYYSDVSSFLWYRINQRNLPKQYYDLVILGDSQILTGINPKILSEKTNQSILFIPRPSEQPEGIWNKILELESKGIQYKKILFNISPLTVSKNMLSNSHRALATNFDSFHWRYYTEPILRKTYLKTISDSIHYMVIQIFPLLKVNSSISSEIKFIPVSKKVHFSEEKIDQLLGSSFFNLLEDRFYKNNLLEKILVSNDYHWEWENYSNGRICKPNKDNPKLQPELASAFINPRKETIVVWKKIIEHLTKKNITIQLLYIPFSPLSESVIQTRNPYSPFSQAIQALESETKVKILLVENLLLQEDFSDYIHPNTCGSEKITKIIVDL